MASTATTDSDRHADYRLTVSSYDRTASMIIALLVIVGCAVTGMAVVFFTGKFVRTIEPIPVVPVEATSPNANQGMAQEPDPPGAEDAPELSEPQLEQTLETLASTVVEDIMLSDTVKEAGKGKGKGDNRMAGSGSGGVVERVPRWERWKFRFEPSSAKEFAEWLDQYQIEVGVLGRDNKVHYAGKLSSASAKIYTGDPMKETRGYTSAADGPMPKLTNDLARKAGIARHGNIVLIFYPFDVESILWDLERKYSGGRDANDFRETVFAVVNESGTFRFEVIDQRYF